MPSIFRSAVGCMYTLSKLYLNTHHRHHAYRHHRSHRHRRHHGQHRRLEQNRMHRINRSSSLKRKKSTRSLLSVPYFEVQCREFGGWRTNRIQLWLSIKTLMIHVLDDGRKIHRHWKVIKYIRKFSQSSLTIVFDDEMMRKLHVRFRSKLDRKHFLLICHRFGRISDQPKRYRGRWLFFLRLQHKYPIIHDLPDETLSEKQKLEQREILKRFLNSDCDSCNNHLSDDHH